MEGERKKVVVCGAGVIGAAVAFYLAEKSKERLEICVLDRVGVACAASGKAGGFLALDWCDTQTIGPLTRKSFQLHEELAKQLDGAERYGYRRLDTFGVSIDATTPGAKKQKSSSRGGKVMKDFENKLSWIDGPGASPSSSVTVLGTTKTTAQVHPFLFTNALLDAIPSAESEAAASSPVVLKRRFGVQVTSLAYDEQNNCIGVRVLSEGETQTEEVIPADVVVLALGPWSSSIRLAASEPQPQDSKPRKKKLRLPIEAEGAHSVVIEPKSPIPPSALFLSYVHSPSSPPFASPGSSSSHIGEIEAEVYPRPDGTVYMCIADSSVGNDEHPIRPLPDDPAQVLPLPRNNTILLEIARQVSASLHLKLDAGEQPKRQQVCYLPVCTRDGKPIIGQLDLSTLPSSSSSSSASHSTKVFVATGHSCWGILNAPATGAALAELILEGRSSIDLSPFDPNRVFC